MTDVADGTERIELDVPEMDCASCAGKVEGALDRLDGIVDYDTHPTTGRLVVRYDPDRQAPADLAEAVRKAGYGIAGSSVDIPEAGIEADGNARGDGDPGGKESVWRSRRAVKTWIGGAFTVAGLLLEFVLVGENVGVVGAFGRVLFLADVLFLAAVAAAGETILTNGYYSVRNRNLDIDLLMSVAILGALSASFGFGAGLYMEAALLAFLFGVAELLERYSIDRARSSLRELLELSPEEARVRRDGTELTVPVEEVRVGDTVIVRPGEKIPVDGSVTAGESAVNQAPITGESVPVDKAVGDGVYAGTINQSGYLEVDVTATAGDSTLSRIIELVENAQANRTEREQFVDRFAGYYTPIVVGLAVLTAVVPPVLIDGSWAVGPIAGIGYTFPGAWDVWFLYGLTLLVLACPCAFVISTPVSVVSGVTSAAKNGVLVKGGNHLEAMGEVDVIAFDKTGTLTKGSLAVTDVVPLNGRTESEVLRCARGIESRSEHPIGEAIVDHAAESGIDRPTVSDFQSYAGKGVEATVADRTHYAGKPGLFEQLGFDLSHVHLATDGGAVTATSRAMCERNDCLDLLEGTIPELQSQGKTVVLVGTDEELEGVIAVADEIRPEAKATIRRLRDLGVERTVMLTGDNERTAAAIAAELDVDEYRAGLLPEEKVAAVEELERSTRAGNGGGVAMVGDGVNDAPSLATATVGIAMGAAGTDTAIETADVALMSDDLSRLPYLYELAHASNGVIRQNVWASLAAKALLAAGVPFGLVPVWAAVLIGDAGMTVGVTGNALRLSRIAPEEA
ncbi:MAG: cation-translocating P-type ATPase [Haloferacaceae archaeon]